MNRQHYEKTTKYLEDAIVHFLVIDELEIVAELCELLLKYDDSFNKDKIAQPAC